MSYEMSETFDDDLTTPVLPQDVLSPNAEISSDESEGDYAGKTVQSPKEEFDLDDLDEVMDQDDDAVNLQEEEEEEEEAAPAHTEEVRVTERELGEAREQQAQHDRLEDTESTVVMVEDTESDVVMGEANREVEFPVNSSKMEAVESEQGIVIDYDGDESEYNYSESGDSDLGSDADYEQLQPKRKRLKKSKKKQRKTNKSKEKYPDAPRKAKSAVEFFYEAKKEMVRMQNPEKSDDEIDQILRRMFAELSSQARQIYHDQELTDKLRYEKESAKYLKIYPGWKKQKIRVNSKPPTQPKPKKRKLRKAAQNNILMPGNAAAFAASEASAEGEMQYAEGAPPTYFEEVVDRLKSKRRRGFELSADGLAEYSKVVMDNMDQAAKGDFELNRQRRPATNKLMLLPEVISQVNKKSLQKDLLDNGLLMGIRDWLKPLPDGSLPSLKVRTELYHLLDKLDITADALTESEGLGVEIMKLWKHPNENSTNRKLLHRLIEKWCRHIFDLPSDYKELEHVERNRQDEIRERADLLRKSQRRHDDANRARARMPDRAWYDFAIRPESKSLSEEQRSEMERGSSSKTSKRSSIQKKFIQIQKKSGPRQARSVKITTSQR